MLIREEHVPPYDFKELEDEYARLVIQYWQIADRIREVLRQMEEAGERRRSPRRPKYLEDIPPPKSEGGMGTPNDN